MSTWEKNKVGCILLEKQLARPFKKGDRREHKPSWDNNKCTKCALCYLYCPDAAIRETGEGLFEADSDYCKGCGVCARECWFGAISMVEEQ